MELINAFKAYSRLTVGFKIYWWTESVLVCLVFQVLWPSNSIYQQDVWAFDLKLDRKQALQEPDNVSKYMQPSLVFLYIQFLVKKGLFCLPYYCVKKCTEFFDLKWFIWHESHAPTRRVLKEFTAFKENFTLYINNGWNYNAHITNWIKF